MASSARSQRVVEFFCRHLVALTVRVKGKDGREQADAHSCFVMEIRGVWFLVTAGHVIRKLEAIAASRGLTVVEWGLFDAWNDNLASRTQVPFSFPDSHKFAIDEKGLDVGVIEIHPFVKRTLEANGIEALEPKTWRDVPDDLDAYFMLGLPSDLISPSHEGMELESLKIEPVLVPVTKCEPPAQMVKPFPRFYGQLADELRDSTGDVLGDMDGMSGGPIIGLRKLDAGAAYFLVAVQGSWHSDFRVVAGTYAEALGWALDLELGDPSGTTAT